MFVLLSTKVSVSASRIVITIEKIKYLPILLGSDLPISHLSATR